MQPESLKKNILRLGLVSLLNDLGSEILTRLIPFYVTGILGAPMSAVGAIEGIAEATATLAKPFFGELSDRLKKRKLFVGLGYALPALARPFLAIAGAWPLVALLRFADRLGKGIRKAPMDALIADSGEHDEHGRNFGLTRALDTIGALVGVLAYGGWLWHSKKTAAAGSLASPASHDLTQSSWSVLVVLCAVSSLLALLLVIGGIKEVKPSAIPVDAAGVTGVTKSANAAPPRLNPLIRRYLCIMVIFGLAGSSDAFILLRARDLGYSLLEVVGMIALLNIAAALTALPAALLSDRMGRRTLIAAGWTIYALTYAALGTGWGAESRVEFAALLAFYGLFYGFTESVESAWIADLAPGALRGRAYGLFGLVTGLSALPASLAFGWAWDRFGSEVPFLATAALALISCGLLFILLPGGRPRPLSTDSPKS